MGARGRAAGAFDVRRFDEALEQAERLAGEIAEAKEGGRFPALGVGGVAIVAVLLRDREELTRRIRSLEERAVCKWDEARYDPE